jgi:hypothetical protein
VFTKVRHCNTGSDESYCVTSLYCTGDNTTRNSKTKPIFIINLDMGPSFNRSQFRLTFPTFLLTRSHWITVTVDLYITFRKYISLSLCLYGHTELLLQWISTWLFGNLSLSLSLYGHTELLLQWISTWLFGNLSLSLCLHGESISSYPKSCKQLLDTQNPIPFHKLSNCKWRMQHKIQRKEWKSLISDSQNWSDVHGGTQQWNASVGAF